MKTHIAWLTVLCVLVVWLTIPKAEKLNDAIYNVNDTIYNLSQKQKENRITIHHYYGTQLEEMKESQAYCEREFNEEMAELCNKHGFRNVREMLTLHAQAKHHPETVNLKSGIGYTYIPIKEAYDKLFYPGRKLEKEIKTREDEKGETIKSLRAENRRIDEQIAQLEEPLAKLSGETIITGTICG